MWLETAYLPWDCPVSWCLYHCLILSYRMFITISYTISVAYLPFNVLNPLSTMCFQMSICTACSSVWISMHSALNPLLQYRILHLLEAWFLQLFHFFFILSVYWSISCFTLRRVYIDEPIGPGRWMYNLYMYSRQSMTFYRIRLCTQYEVCNLIKAMNAGSKSMQIQGGYE